MREVELGSATFRSIVLGLDSTERRRFRALSLGGYGTLLVGAPETRNDYFDPPEGLGQRLFLVPPGSSTAFQLATDARSDFGSGFDGAALDTQFTDANGSVYHLADSSQGPLLTYLGQVEGQPDTGTLLGSRERGTAYALDEQHTFPVIGRKRLTELLDSLEFQPLAGRPFSVTGISGPDGQMTHALYVDLLEDPGTATSVARGVVTNGQIAAEVRVRVMDGFILWANPETDRVYETPLSRHGGAVAIGERHGLHMSLDRPEMTGVGVGRLLAGLSQMRMPGFEASPALFGAHAGGQTAA